MNIMSLLKDELLLSEDELKKFIATCPYRYKRYEIPKRSSSEKRLIAHPSKELKTIQRIITNLLKDKLPVHSAAFAYRKGISIKDNANIHKLNKYILKMDCKNFFPNITPDFLFKELKRYKIEFDDMDRYILEHIIFWKPKRNSGFELSVGAPSSPLISNFVLFSFDNKISEICSDNNISYTRYADDMTFSTSDKGILFDYIEVITKTIELETYGNIKINKEKTKFSSMKFNRHVTGITITNAGNLSLGREKERKLSAGIHRFQQGKLNDIEIAQLRGHLSFAVFINESFYYRMRRKYGENIINSLIKKRG